MYKYEMVFIKCFETLKYFLILPSLMGFFVIKMRCLFFKPNNQLFFENKLYVIISFQSILKTFLHSLDSVDTFQLLSHAITIFSDNSPMPQPSNSIFGCARSQVPSPRLPKRDEIYCKRSRSKQRRLTCP